MLHRKRETVPERSSVKRIRLHASNAFPAANASDWSPLVAVDISVSADADLRSPG